MKFLPDHRLYAETETCLQFLRELPDDRVAIASGSRERVHLYWGGEFGRKPAFAVKSLLATQDLNAIELWLWLDGERGYHGHLENRWLRPLLPFVSIRRFDPAEEARGTLFEGQPGLYRGLPPRKLADYFRFLVLYQHGGLYADMDTMFLRDLRPLLREPTLPDEFCYRWSGEPYANSAVLRLQQNSRTAATLLARCVDLGDCSPAKVLHFDRTRDLDLGVLPSTFFDPLWLHRDGRDHYAPAPYNRFAHFFRRFTWWFRRNPTVRSYRDFFPGAFTYHWHGYWRAREHRASYFGMFDREFDAILRNRLAGNVPAL